MSPGAPHLLHVFATFTAAGATVGGLIGAGRTHGRRLLDRLRGMSELRCDDGTLRRRSLSGGACSTVRRLIYVIRMSSGRVDLDHLGKALFLDKMPENAFRCRRAADIAHTDE